MIPRMVVRSAIALRAALVSTLACVACSTTRAPAASESARGRSNSVGQPLARLQRMSECWGPCPDYAVEIDIDGNLNYRGGDNVLTHGSATGRLSAEEMNKLREALERWRHFQFVAEPCGFLRELDVAIDGENLGAFLRETQDRRAAVTHAFAGPLAGADDDGDLAVEAHRYPPCPNRPLPPDSRVFLSRWAARKTMSTEAHVRASRIDLSK